VELEHTSRKMLFKYRRLVTVILVGISLPLFVYSYFGSNTWALLMGLAFLVYGLSLLFVTSTKMIRADLLVTQLSSLTLSLDDTLQASGIGNKTYILPPRLQGEQPIQVIEGRSQKSRASIIPTGLHLASLFEAVAGQSFFSLDLSMLEDLLVRVVVENLEIARDFRLLREEERIIVKMNDFVFSDFYNYIQPLVANKDRIIFSCPTVSALACAFAKSTQKAILVESATLVRQNLEIKFRLFVPWEIDSRALQWGAAGSSYRESRDSI